MEARPPQRRPYDLQLRERVCHLYFVSKWKCSEIAATPADSLCSSPPSSISSSSEPWTAAITA
eukprot:540624-Pelagomonas_calceolata.AAC.1